MYGHGGQKRRRGIANQVLLYVALFVQSSAKGHEISLACLVFFFRISKPMPGSCETVLGDPWLGGHGVWGIGWLDSDIGWLDPMYIGLNILTASPCMPPTEPVPRGHGDYLRRCIISSSLSFMFLLCFKV